MLDGDTIKNGQRNLKADLIGCYDCDPKLRWQKEMISMRYEYHYHHAVIFFVFYSKARKIYEVDFAWIEIGFFSEIIKWQEKRQCATYRRLGVW